MEQDHVYMTIEHHSYGYWGLGNTGTYGYIVSKDLWEKIHTYYTKLNRWDWEISECGMQRLSIDMEDNRIFCCMDDSENMTSYTIKIYKVVSVENKNCKKIKLADDLFNFVDLIFYVRCTEPDFVAFEEEMEKEWEKLEKEINDKNILSV